MHTIHWLMNCTGPHNRRPTYCTTSNEMEGDHSQDSNFSPVEVRPPGVHPSVLVLFQHSCIKVTRGECVIEDVGGHPCGVHGGVDPFSGHGVSEASCVSQHQDVVVKRLFFTTNTESSCGGQRSKLGSSTTFNG